MPFNSIDFSGNAANAYHASVPISLLTKAELMGTAGSSEKEWISAFSELK